MRLPLPLALDRQGSAGSGNPAGSVGGAAPVLDVGDDGWLTLRGQLLGAARRQLHELQQQQQWEQQQRQQQWEQLEKDAAVEGLSLVGTSPSSDATAYSSTGDAVGSAFTSGSVGSASAGIMGSDAAAAAAAAGGEGAAGAGAEELWAAATALHLGDPEASASAAVRLRQVRKSTNEPQGNRVGRRGITETVLTVRKQNGSRAASVLATDTCLKAVLCCTVRLRQVWVSNAAWGCGQLAKLLVLTHNTQQLGLQAPTAPPSTNNSNSSTGAGEDLGGGGADANSGNSGSSGGGGELGLGPGLGVVAGRYANSPPRLVRLGVQAVVGGGTGAPGEAFVGQAVTVGGGVEDPDGDGLDLRLVWYGVPPRWVVGVVVIPALVCSMYCMA